METNNDALIPFLRNLADSIEKQQLLPTQLQSIGEFFMMYNFQEQTRRDNIEIKEEAKPAEKEFSKEDLLKFLSMGWYIYQILLKDKSIPLSDDLD